MQFPFVLCLFAMLSTVLALPTGHTYMRVSCDIAACVAALAPTVVGCVAAAAQSGANVIADAACLAATTNSAINVPASCDQCLVEFGIPAKLDQAGAKIKGVAGQVANDAGGVIKKVEGELGSIF